MYLNVCDVVVYANISTVEHVCTFCLRVSVWYFYQRSSSIMLFATCKIMCAISVYDVCMYVCMYVVSPGDDMHVRVWVLKG